MKTRILTAVLIVAVALPLIFFSEYIVFPIALGLLAGVSVLELLRSFGYEKRLSVAIPAVSISLFLPICAYFAVELLMWYFATAFVVLYLFLLYMLMLSVFSKGKIKFSRAASVFATTAYVSISFSAISVLRYSIPLGEFFFVLPFVIAWVSDVFALFVGKLFGKHKLIPEVSPKKTVEGLFGGIVFATVGALVYGLLVDGFFDTISVNYIVLALMGAGFSLISQLGDLIASTIKREEGIKDYGSILPGHGGITDRFDSIYAISLLVLIACVLFKPFA